MSEILTPPPHKVVDLLALALEPLGPVRHLALALRRTHRAAEVGLAGLAELALLALGGVEGNDVVSDLDVVDALADRLDDAAPLVAQDDRERALGVLAGERVVVAGLEMGNGRTCGRYRCWG